MLFRSSGEGILNEPAIYEVGTARIRDFSGDPINMYFVEMGKVITFKDWVNRNNLDYSQWDEIIYVLFVFYEQNPSPSEVDSKTIMRFVAREYTGDIKALPQGTLLQLIKATVVYYHKNGILKDLHAGNLGVIPSNIEGKEDIFVFFDV